jgi:hypothetical protein
MKQTDKQTNKQTNKLTNICPALKRLKNTARLRSYDGPATHKQQAKQPDEEVSSQPVVLWWYLLATSPPFTLS